MNVRRFLETRVKRCVLTTRNKRANLKKITLIFLTATLFCLSACSHCDACRITTDTDNTADQNF